MTVEKTYSVEEAAQYFGISLYTMRKYLRDGRIKGFKMARAWRIRESELNKFMEGSEGLESSCKKDVLKEEKQPSQQKETAAEAERSFRIEKEVKEIAEKTGLAKSNKKVLEMAENNIGLSKSTIKRYLHHCNVLRDYPDLSDMTMHKAIEEASKRKKEEEEDELAEISKTVDFTDEEVEQYRKVESLYLDADKLSCDVANGGNQLEVWVRWFQKYGHVGKANRFARILRQLADGLEKKYEEIIKSTGVED